MKKKMFFVLLAMTVIMAQAFCSGTQEGTSGESKGAKHFKLGYVVARHPDHPYTVAAETFANAVNEKTNGEVVIDLYPGGQLGGDRDMFEAIKMNTLDLGVISSPVIAGFTPVLEGSDMPWLFENDYDLMYKAQAGEAGRKALDALEKDTGVKALTFEFQPFRHFFTNKEIKGISDFKGLKLRSMESSVHIDTWKAIGANPTPIPYPEVYTAMQTNTVDGFESDVIGANASKFYEVAKYITISGHFNNSVVLVMSNKAWSSLNPEQQKAVEEASKLSAEASMKTTKEENDKYMKVMEEKGMIINTIDLQELQNAAQSVYDKYSSVPEVKAFIDAVNALK